MITDFPHIPSLHIFPEGSAFITLGGKVSIVHLLIIANEGLFTRHETRLCVRNVSVIIASELMRYHTTVQGRGTSHHT